MKVGSEVEVVAYTRSQTAEFAEVHQKRMALVNRCKAHLRGKVPDARMYSNALLCRCQHQNCFLLCDIGLVYLTYVHHRHLLGRLVCAANCASI